MAGPSRTAADPSRHRHYKVQPPRPPNAWILYRRSKSDQVRLPNERLSQAEISKRIALLWRSETEHVKRHFERLAEEEKERHQQMYPDYRFCPKKKEQKLQEKEDRKQSRRAKKSKDRDATSPDAEDANANATPPMPVPPPVPYISQPFVISGYRPDMALPPYMVPYPPPEVRYGPAGPSPPISAAPTPGPYESSESPEVQPFAEANVSSSSSSPSVHPSPSAESQGSSSSQLYTNQMYPSPLPGSHQPSPNPYATQLLPTLPYQTPAPSELLLTSPQVQLPVERIAVPTVPVWNNIPTQQPSLDFQNSQEVINFDIPLNQSQSFEEFQRCVSGASSFESIQGLLSGTDGNGVFSLSSIDSSDLLSQPQGDLEVAMGAQASTVDYNGQLFVDYDIVEFEQQMAAFRECASGSAPGAAPSAQDDLQALFHAPSNPEVEVYMAAQQRQPSVFTQDMMHFLNFEAAEGSNEDASIVSPPPVPTIVAPQQVRLQSPQHGAAIPIFTQMTNVPTVVSDVPYVPPAGAIYSSTRRVGGSWKPTFVNPGSQVEEAFRSWRSL